jgi:hypothetical protein
MKKLLFLLVVFTNTYFAWLKIISATRKSAGFDAKDHILMKRKMLFIVDQDNYNGPR